MHKDVVILCLDNRLILLHIGRQEHWHVEYHVAPVHDPEDHAGLVHLVQEPSIPVLFQCLPKAHAFNHLLPTSPQVDLTV